MDWKSQYKEMHERLGCPGCRYANSELIFKDACCNYIGLITTDDDTGACLTRKEK